MTLEFRLISKQSPGLLRAIEAPADMRAEFKLYLKDLRFGCHPQLSLPLEN